MWAGRGADAVSAVVVSAVVVSAVVVREEDVNFGGTTCACSR